MSFNSEDKNKKLPLEIINNLLTKLLDSKLNKLEAKAKNEMNIIKSLSQNKELIINELHSINKKIKPYTNTKKIVNKYQPLNLNKKNNVYKVSPKLSTTNCSIITKRNERTPDRKYYSKIKKTKTNCTKTLRYNRSEIFANEFLNNKSTNVSKILNHSRIDNNSNINRIKRKSRSKNKNNRDLTPRPSTPDYLLRKKKKEKHRICQNNTSLIKHNNLLSSRNFNKSCRILPIIKKDKLNISKISKDELDLLGDPMLEEDKRIYQLNPEISKSLLNKNKNENKKITSLLFKKSSKEIKRNKKEENKEILTLDDSMINDMNNDELLIFYHNKKSTKLIDDITLSKSLFGDEPDDEINIEINFGNHHHNLNNFNKNNNYTLAEKLENILDYLTKYLTIEELLKIDLINKECFKMIMQHLISKREDSIDDTKELLLLLKNNNSDLIDPNENNNNFNSMPFEFNRHSARAIQLLRSMTVENIFQNNKLIEKKNKNIMLVFDIFFIALGYKKKILSFKNDIKSKWNFYKNFFEKSNNNIGVTIENKIKGKIFDIDTINTLYEYSHNHISIITPSFFQNIDNDIALFVFIVKNILEHVGITKDVNNKKNIPKLYLLYNARIYSNTIILQRLNKINAIISNK